MHGQDDAQWHIDATKRAKSQIASTGMQSHADRKKAQARVSQTHIELCGLMHPCCQSRGRVVLANTRPNIVTLFFDRFFSYQISFSANWMSLGCVAKASKPPAPVDDPSALKIWALPDPKKALGDEKLA
jgi:hypothetical protein